MQQIRSIHESAAVKSALELRVFTRLGSFSRRGHGTGGIGVGDTRAWEGATAEDMAQECGCAERGMRILLDALATASFIRKQPSRQGVRRQGRWVCVCICVWKCHVFVDIGVFIFLKLKWLYETVDTLH